MDFYIPGTITGL